MKHSFLFSLQPKQWQTYKSWGFVLGAEMSLTFCNIFIINHVIKSNKVVFINDDI